MTIADDQSFQARVYYFMQKAAIAVSSEDQVTTNHALRVAFATKILGGTALVKTYSVGVVTNATIASTANALASPDFGILDSDIEFVVNSLYDAFSGVSK